MSRVSSCCPLLLADLLDTGLCPSAGSREHGDPWNVGVWVHSACTWLMSSAAVPSGGRRGKAYTKVAAPSEAPLERLPWGADSGCTVGLVILLWLLRDGFGWQASALPTLLYLPLESAHLQSMDLPGRAKWAKPGTRLCTRTTLPDTRVLVPVSAHYCENVNAARQAPSMWLYACGSTSGNSLHK